MRFFCDRMLQPQKPTLYFTFFRLSANHFPQHPTIVLFHPICCIHDFSHAPQSALQKNSCRVIQHIIVTFGVKSIFSLISILAAILSNQLNAQKSALLILNFKTIILSFHSISSFKLLPPAVPCFFK